MPGVLDITFSDELAPTSAPPEENGALDFSAFTELLNSQPVADVAPIAQGPNEVLPLDERVKLAYGDPPPPSVARFFAWESEMTLGGYQPVLGIPGAMKATLTGGELLQVAGQISAASLAARKRLEAATRRLPELEGQLAKLKVEHAEICAALESPPQLTDSPRAIGLLAVDKAGYERLLPVVEHEIERAREEVAQAERHGLNWDVLYRVSLVIVGNAKPDDSLARKIGLEYGWRICSPVERRRREEQRRRDAEREAAEAPKREAERRAFAKEMAEQEERDRAQAAEIAAIDLSDFLTLFDRVFFGKKGTSLDEMKRFAAGWQANLALKQVISDWPNRPTTHLSELAQKELRKMIPTGDPVYDHAVRRLSQLVHS
jgi:hypothetical protein